MANEQRIENILKCLNEDDLKAMLIASYGEAVSENNSTVLDEVRRGVLMLKGFYLSKDDVTSYARIKKGAKYMSYDIALIDPHTGSVAELQDGKKHQIKGGTFVVGGTSLLQISITYNYSNYFYKAFGPRGIRVIYGMTARESIPLLAKAAASLGSDGADANYWISTPGNAKKAIQALRSLAQMAPAGVIWQGD